MNARTSWVAGTLLATAAIPWAACAADAPAATDAPVIVAQASSTPSAAPGCPTDTGLSSLQQRLLAKYDRDPQSMLGFVWITRNIYLLERGETAAWAEEYRRTHKAC